MGNRDTGGMSNIVDDFPYWACYADSIENCIKADGLRGTYPAGAFFMPRGGESNAKETKEAVFLPRLSEADRGTLL